MLNAVCKEYSGLVPMSPKTTPVRQGQHQPCALPRLWVFGRRWRRVRRGLRWRLLAVGSCGYSLASNGRTSRKPGWLPATQAIF
jgi:hypothetical protein